MLRRPGRPWPGSSSTTVHHGPRTLFGAFGGSGVHPQALYFAHVAHLQPATFFAVLGGIIECFGGAAVGVGTFGRLAALGLLGEGRFSLDVVLRRLFRG